MANELPEVVPEVQSMPTMGWACQTSGNARRRITKNTSSIDTEGIFDVAGVPGHTHNANAVVSVDADYSAYRQSALNVGTGIWGYGALEMPVGLLTDSVEPDHAEERFERAIERCVGYVSLFPENCTGHIQEPTRSIGEIRTLVAPKARLDTLTYTEERRGWRVPHDADDVKETTEREALVSDFPDVYIDVRPLTLVEQATIDLDVSPGSLYMETAANRYRVVDTGQPADAKGFIGYTSASDQTLRAAQDTRLAAGAAGDAAALIAAQALVASATAARAASWDGTLRFVWDYDSRSYKTQSAVSVILNEVRQVALDGTAQNPVYDYDPQNVAGGNNADGVPIAADPANNHVTRITVTFGILETTTAFDGFCWLGNMNNEEALNYAARNKGLALAPRFDIEVLGIKVSIGPFKWIGMPAYRIPVGSAYAHPCSDILQESFGDGNHGDMQYNYWDKFDAFTVDATAADFPFDGFLRYQWRSAEAFRNHAAADAALLIAIAALQQAPNDAALILQEQQARLLVLVMRAKVGNEAFDLTARAAGTNGGMFYPRTGGILRQLTADHYDPQPNFNEDAVHQYTAALAGNLVDANLITPGIELSNRHKFDGVGGNAAVSAAAQCPPLIYDADGNIHSEGDFADRPFSPFGDMVGPISFTLKSTTSFTFRAIPFAGVPAALAPFVSDRFCVVPMTPLFYKITDALAEGGIGDFSGNAEFFLGKVVNGVRRYVPKVICNCTAVVGDQLQLRYDLSKVMFTERAYRLTGTTLDDPGGMQADAHFWIRGWSNWLPPNDAVKSNFDANADNLPVEDAQGMRNTFKDNFQTGNKFLVPAGTWWSVDHGGPAHLGALFINDYVFALPLKDFGGLYFETALATATGRKLCFFAHKSAGADDIRPRSEFRYEAVGGAGTAFVHGRITTGGGGGMHVYVWDQAAGNNVVRRAPHAELHANVAQDLNMYILGPDWYRTHIGNDPHSVIRDDSMRLGAVFQSVKRISQHVCGPVLNPNVRIGAQAPLNHDTRHLPPELRDFRLQLHDIDWGRLQADSISLNELTLYEFKGGNQKQGAEQNILYMPEFREFKTPVTDNTFEFECYSNLGSPSYFCLFCRSHTTDILQQPLIRTLSIFNNTTSKKSNAVRDLSIGQLYHMTQRNVNPLADYNRTAYNRRQTILLSAEDVGLMGLKRDEYQKAKRVKYTFSGTTDQPGTLYVVMVYNNRGLHIDGRRLQLVSLHE